MSWLQHIVALTVASVAVLFALGVGVYITPQQYKEKVFNDIVFEINNYVNFTAVMEEIVRRITPEGKNFLNQNTEEKDANKFHGVIPVDENGKDSSTDIKEGRKFNNFQESHICQLSEEIQQDKYDEIIENIGEEVALSKTLIKKMVLSKHQKKTSYSITQFNHSSNGMYIYGRFEAARNWNKEMDFVVALYKVSWTLPSAEKVKSSKDELYAQWSQLHDGTNDMVPEQGKKDLKKKFDLFLEVNLKGDNDEAATMEESQELKEYLRQLVDKNNKKECKAELVTPKKQKTDEG